MRTFKGVLGLMVAMVIMLGLLMVAPSGARAQYVTTPNIEDYFGLGPTDPYGWSLPSPGASGTTVELQEYFSWFPMYYYAGNEDYNHIYTVSNMSASITINSTAVIFYYNNGVPVGSVDVTLSDAGTTNVGPYSISIFDPYNYYSQYPGVPPQEAVSQAYAYVPGPATSWVSLVYYTYQNKGFDFIFNTASIQFSGSITMSMTDSLDNSGNPINYTVNVGWLAPIVGSSGG